MQLVSTVLLDVKNYVVIFLCSPPLDICPAFGAKGFDGSFFLSLEAIELLADGIMLPGWDLGSFTSFIINKKVDSSNLQNLLK